MDKEILSHLAKPKQAVQKPNTYDLKEVIEKALLEGKTLKEALDIDTNLCEEIYVLAHRAYTTEQLDHAFNLFQLLAQIDPKEYRYVYGTAACLWKKKEYTAAAFWFGLASEIKPTLEALFYCGECLMALQAYEDAQICFKKVLELGNKEHTLVCKASLLLEQIDQHLL